MVLGKNYVNNRLIKRFFSFSIVFILFFSCLSFFYVERTMAAPTIIVKNPEFNSVIYDKTPTIKISYSDEVGIDLDSVAFYLDNVDLTSYANVSMDGVIFTPPSNLALGRHTILITVSDTFNNSTIKTGAFNIGSSISSIEKDIGDVNASDLKEISIDEWTTIPIIINKIILNFKNKLKNIHLFIANLSANYVDVDKPNIFDTDLISYGAGYSIKYTNNLFTYSYLAFELLSNDTSIDENLINSITLKFKILKSWITSNNVDKTGVRLLRYADDSWQELTSTFDSEDNDYVYYSVVTKSFPLFAVVAPELLAEEPQGESGGINILLIIGVIIAVIVLIIGFLFWRGYLYIER